MWAIVPQLLQLSHGVARTGIDSRTFSIAADVCQDGTGIRVGRPVTPLVDAAERQRERMLNQERDEHALSAAERERAAEKTKSAARPTHIPTLSSTKCWRYLSGEKPVTKLFRSVNFFKSINNR